MRTFLTALLLGAIAVATALTVTQLPYYDHKTAGASMVLITAGLWLAFAAAYLLVRRIPMKAAVILIVAGSVAIGGAAMAGPPNLSTDSARYAWDGIVQNAGISPYKYVPTSPKLEALRTEWLFPTPVVDASGEASCEGARIQTSHEPGTDTVVCTALNRATSPTIYPPSSELLFAGIRFLTGPTPEYWPLQLAGLLMSVGITLLLIRTLRRSGLDPRWAALWAWCPLVATEAVTNSHVDTLGALMLLLATALVATGKRWWGGIALGAAIAAKLIPVIGAPALLRRQPWKIVIAAVATFLLLYVPYILTSGIKVLGYLPKYLSEEGYDDGSRFALITPFAGGTAALAIAAVLLVVVGVLVWINTDPAHPWVGQLVMIGATLLIVSPRYPWYALLLVPMVAMTGRWEWLAVALALSVRTLEPYIAVTRIGELIALVLILVMSCRRAGPDALGRLRRWARHPYRSKSQLESEPAPSRVEA